MGLGNGTPEWIQSRHGYPLWRLCAALRIRTTFYLEFVLLKFRLFVPYSEFVGYISKNV